jgi:hypothetical protein
MPVPFFLAMFVLPSAIIGTAVVLAELSRRSDKRAEKETG